MTDEEMEARIPTPVGYHVLVMMPTIEKTFGDSAIIKADKTQHEESIMSMIGAVVDMGEQAYKDEDRFPNGPWCEVGDYVMFRRNSGTRFKIDGQEYRLMNDDSIEAVVKDPQGVEHI